MSNKQISCERLNGLITEKLARDKDIVIVGQGKRIFRGFSGVKRLKLGDRKRLGTGILNVTGDRYP